MTYGTGAIMAVPAHDERDFAFALKFGLPILPVIADPHAPTKSFVRNGNAREAFIDDLTNEAIPFTSTPTGLQVSIPHEKIGSYIEIARQRAPGAGSSDRQVVVIISKMGSWNGFGRGGKPSALAAGDWMPGFRTAWRCCGARNGMRRAHLWLWQHSPFQGSPVLPNSQAGSD
jgi:hypothetical protein